MAPDPDEGVGPRLSASGRGEVTAFVLGGGGLLGAAEVGMLAALLDRGIVPDLVVGTSIGAINGAMVARDPSAATIERMAGIWSDLGSKGPFAAPIRQRLEALARSSGVAMYPTEPLQSTLQEHLPERFEDLAVPFWCCAASIERSAEVWFSAGDLLPAVMASSALPGVFPPMTIDGEHFIDGGIVNSIPLDRARKLGATRVFVLQVGRIEQSLTVPRRPWQVAQVAFEVARRARFHAALARTRESIDVYVLPTGGGVPDPTSWRTYDFRDTRRLQERLAGSRAAAAAYLDQVDAGLIDPRATPADDPVVGT
ncbi:MAG: patatin-like phospholipase family protein [Actinobacteria bacterium]|nr:MAG: patatin-like phospholipase family protein [Actinomycetota bacterium]